MPRSGARPGFSCRVRSAVVVGALAAAAALATGLGPPSYSAEVRTTPDSIATDCSRDVTDELNTWLASLPRSGVTVQLRPAACYLVNRTVTVADAHEWRIDGQHAVLMRSEYTPPELRYPQANPHLLLSGVTDTTVTNLAIRGMNSVSDAEYLRPEFGAYNRDFEFEHGVLVRDSARVRLADLVVYEVFGDGAYLAGNSGVTVSGIVIDKNGRQGIALVEGSDTLVENTWILHSRRSGIDLEPNAAGQVIDGVRIRATTIGSQLLAVTGGGAGIVRNVTVEGNTITRSGVPFVSVNAAGGSAQWTGWVVAHNVVQPALGSPQAAIRVIRANAVVTGNEVPLTVGRSGLGLELRNGATVTAACNWFKDGNPPLGALVDATSALVDGGGNSVDARVRPVCGP